MVTKNEYKNFLQKETLLFQLENNKLTFDTDSLILLIKNLRKTKIYNDIIFKVKNNLTFSNEIFEQLGINKKELLNKGLTEEETQIIALYREFVEIAQNFSVPQTSKLINDVIPSVFSKQFANYMLVFTNNKFPLQIKNLEEVIKVLGNNPEAAVEFMDRIEKLQNEFLNNAKLFEKQGTGKIAKIKRNEIIRIFHTDFLQEIKKIKKDFKEKYGIKIELEEKITPYIVNELGTENTDEQNYQESLKRLNEKLGEWDINLKEEREKFFKDIPGEVKDFINENYNEPEKIIDIIEQYESFDLATLSRGEIGEKILKIDYKNTEKLKKYTEIISYFFMDNNNNPIFKSLQKQKINERSNIVKKNILEQINKEFEIDRSKLMKLENNLNLILNNIFQHIESKVELVIKKEIDMLKEDNVSPEKFISVLKKVMNNDEIKRVINASYQEIKILLEKEIGISADKLEKLPIFSNIRLMTFENTVFDLLQSIDGIEDSKLKAEVYKNIIEKLTNKEIIDEKIFFDIKNDIIMQEKFKNMFKNSKFNSLLLDKKQTNLYAMLYQRTSFIKLLEDDINLILENKRSSFINKITKGVKEVGNKLGLGMYDETTEEQLDNILQKMENNLLNDLSELGKINKDNYKTKIDIYVEKVFKHYNLNNSKLIDTTLQQKFNELKREYIEALDRKFQEAFQNRDVIKFKKDIFDVYYQGIKEVNKEFITKINQELNKNLYFKELFDLSRVKQELIQQARNGKKLDLLTLVRTEMISKGLLVLPKVIEKLKSELVNDEVLLNLPETERKEKLRYILSSSLKEIFDNPEFKEDVRNGLRTMLKNFKDIILESGITYRLYDNTEITSAKIDETIFNVIVNRIVDNIMKEEYSSLIKGNLLNKIIKAIEKEVNLRNEDKLTEKTDEVLFERIESANKYLLKNEDNLKKEIYPSNDNPLNKRIIYKAEKAKENFDKELEIFIKNRFGISVDKFLEENGITEEENKNKFKKIFYNQVKEKFLNILSEYNDKLELGSKNIGILNYSFAGNKTETTYLLMKTLEEIDFKNILEKINANKPGLEDIAKHSFKKYLFNTKKLPVINNKITEIKKLLEEIKNLNFALKEENNLLWAKDSAENLYKNLHDKIFKIIKYLEEEDILEYVNETNFLKITGNKEFDKKVFKKFTSDMLDKLKKVNNLNDVKEIANYFNKIFDYDRLLGYYNELLKEKEYYLKSIKSAAKLDNYKKEYFNNIIKLNESNNENLQYSENPTSKKLDKIMENVEGIVQEYVEDDKELKNSIKAVIPIGTVDISKKLKLDNIKENLKEKANNINIKYRSNVGFSDEIYLSILENSGLYIEDNKEKTEKNFKNFNKFIIDLYSTGKNIDNLEIKDIKQIFKTFIKNNIEIEYNINNSFLNEFLSINVDNNPSISNNEKKEIKKLLKYIFKSEVTKQINELNKIANSRYLTAEDYETAVNDIINNTRKYLETKELMGVELESNKIDISKYKDVLDKINISKLKKHFKYVLKNGVNLNPEYGTINIKGYNIKNLEKILVKKYKLKKLDFNDKGKIVNYFTYVGMKDFSSSKLKDKILIETIGSLKQGMGNNNAKEFFRLTDLNIILNNTINDNLKNYFNKLIPLIIQKSGIPVDENLLKEIKEKLKKELENEYKDIMLFEAIGKLKEEGKKTKEKIELKEEDYEKKLKNFNEKIDNYLKNSIDLDNYEIELSGNEKNIIEVTKRILKEANEKLFKNNSNLVSGVKKVKKEKHELLKENLDELLREEHSYLKEEILGQILYNNGVLEYLKKEGNLNDKILKNIEILNKENIKLKIDNIINSDNLFSALDLNINEAKIMLKVSFEIDNQKFNTMVKIDKSIILKELINKLETKLKTEKIKELDKEKILTYSVLEDLHTMKIMAEEREKYQDYLFKNKHVAKSQFMRKMFEENEYIYSDYEKEISVLLYKDLYNNMVLTNEKLAKILANIEEENKKLQKLLEKEPDNQEIREKLQELEKQKQEIMFDEYHTRNARINEQYNYLLTKEFISRGFKNLKKELDDKEEISTEYDEIANNSQYINEINIYLNRFSELNMLKYVNSLGVIEKYNKNKYNTFNNIVDYKIYNNIFNSLNEEKIRKLIIEHAKPDKVKDLEKFYLLGHIQNEKSENLINNAVQYIYNDMKEEMQKNNKYFNIKENHIKDAINNFSSIVNFYVENSKGTSTNEILKQLINDLPDKLDAFIKMQQVIEIDKLLELDKMKENNNKTIRSTLERIRSKILSGKKLTEEEINILNKKQGLKLTNEENEKYKNIKIEKNNLLKSLGLTEEEFEMFSKLKINNKELFLIKNYFLGKKKTVFENPGKKLEQDIILTGIKNSNVISYFSYLRNTSELNLNLLNELEKKEFSAEIINNVKLTKLKNIIENILDKLSNNTTKSAVLKEILSLKTRLQNTDSEEEIYNIYKIINEKIVEEINNENNGIWEKFKEQHENYNKNYEFNKNLNYHLYKAEYLGLLKLKEEFNLWENFDNLKPEEQKNYLKNEILKGEISKYIKDIRKKIEFYKIMYETAPEELKKDLLNKFSLEITKIFKNDNIQTFKNLDELEKFINKNLAYYMENIYHKKYENHELNEIMNQIETLHSNMDRQIIEVKTVLSNTGTIDENIKKIINNKYNNSYIKELIKGMVGNIDENKTLETINYSFGDIYNENIKNLDLSKDFNKNSKEWKILRNTVKWNLISLYDHLNNTQGSIDKNYEKPFKIDISNIYTKIMGGSDGNNSSKVNDDIKNSIFKEVIKNILISLGINKINDNQISEIEIILEDLLKGEIDINSFNNKLRNILDKNVHLSMESLLNAFANSDSYVDLVLKKSLQNAKFKEIIEGFHKIRSELNEKLYGENANEETIKNITLKDVLNDEEATQKYYGLINEMNEMFGVSLGLQSIEPGIWVNEKGEVVFTNPATGTTDNEIIPKDELQEIESTLVNNMEVKAWTKQFFNSPLYRQMQNILTENDPNQQWILPNGRAARTIEEYNMTNITGILANSIRLENQIENLESLLSVFEDQEIELDEIIDGKVQRKNIKVIHYFQLDNLKEGMTKEEGFELFKNTVLKKMEKMQFDKEIEENVKQYLEAQGLKQDTPQDIIRYWHHFNEKYKEELRKKFNRLKSGKEYNMSNTVKDEMEKIEEELSKVQSFEELNELYNLYENYQNIKERIEQLKKVKNRLDQALSNPEVLAALKHIVLPRLEKDPSMRNSPLLQRIRNELNKRMSDLGPAIRRNIEKSPMAQFEHYKKQMQRYLHYLEAERRRVYQNAAGSLNLVQKRYLRKIENEIQNISNVMNNINKTLEENNILDPKEQEEFIRTIKEAMKHGYAAGHEMDKAYIKEEAKKGFIRDLKTGKDVAVELVKTGFGNVPLMKETISTANGFFAVFMNKKGYNNKVGESMRQEFGDNRLDTHALGNLSEKEYEELIERNPELLRQYQERYYNNDISIGNNF